MKQKKIFALFVGIDEYAGPVSALSGSVNDAGRFSLYVEETYGNSMQLCMETLKNCEATRENIIRGFREHLGKARKNDVVLFYYSGHGSRQPSAPEFKEFFPEGVDETLVCFDSRTPGGQDLADKEIAILLSEVAKCHPHIAVILDCCHSGSATREGDNNAKAKNIDTRETSRLLESYLDGIHTRQSLNIPTSPHALLAACKREQLAWEINGQGVFTATLLEVLKKSGTSISYADAFIRCRYAIRKLAYNQIPQFESYGGFNAYSTFLEGTPIGKVPRCTVFFEDNAWKMNMGALHGIPTDPKKSTKLVVYQKDSSNEIGHAETIAVNAHISKLELDFAGDMNSLYKAEIRYFPLPPLPVYLEGDKTGKEQLEKALESFPDIVFVDAQKEAHYRLSALHDKYLLFHLDACQLVEGVEGYSSESARYILADVEHIRRWEYSLELQNHGTNFEVDKDVDFRFVEMTGDGEAREYNRDDITLNFKKVNGVWRKIPVKIKVKNNKHFPLHFVLFYFSRKFGIRGLANEPLPPGNGFVTLWGDMGNSGIFLPDNVYEVVDRFKLIVSTEKVDSFLLEQEDLKLENILSKPSFSEFKDVDTAVADDWFTKTIRVKTVRQKV